MSQTSEPSLKKGNSQYTFNLILAAVAGLVGCLTLIIVIAALIIGLWLDKQLNSRPTFTILLMVGSIPVTLITMFLVVKAATSRIKPSTKNNQDQTQEEADRGQTS